MWFCSFSSARECCAERYGFLSFFFFFNPVWKLTSWKAHSPSEKHLNKCFPHELSYVVFDKNEGTGEWRRVSPHTTFIITTYVWCLNVCDGSHISDNLDYSLKTLDTLDITESANIYKYCRVQNKAAAIEKNTFFFFFNGSWIHGLSRLKQVCQFKNNKSRHRAYRDPKLLL